MMRSCFMNEKQHITIHIADAAPLSLNIPRDKEAMARSIAQKVNRSWSEWAAQYNDKTSHDVLAMVAFRYAQVYYELVMKMEAHENALEEVEREFDRILLGVE